MVIRLSARFVSITLLGLLSVLAFALVLRATPEGLGLTDDSIAYVAGARSMLAGDGYREAWLASNGPVTHFPPAYPSALVFLGWFGLDPLRGARLLGAALFGLSTALMGILGWRMTRSLPSGLMLAALFVANGSLLRVHTSALSEPLFIFLGLLAFWGFDLYFERDAHWLWLLVCGSLAGMAYLTRYAGLALAGTFVLALLALHRTWRRRATAVGVFGASLFPWIAGWAIRNSLVGGTVTNRVLVWHPINLGSFDAALRTVSMFLMPIESWRRELYKIPGFFPVLIFAILAAILIWTAWKIWGGLRTTRSGRTQVVSLTGGLFVLGYLASILVAMSFFDASTKFKLRILSPIYVALLMLAVALGSWAWSRRRELVLGVVVAILALSSFGQAALVAELRKGGQGYASFRWYDSKAMAYLRDLPAGLIVYTNEPGAVYLYTGRGAHVLPDRVDPVTAASRPGFERGLEQVQADVNSGKAVLALFSAGDTPLDDAAQLSSGLYVAHKSGGAEIYGAPPSEGG
jgi:4-amino-4-deoxy-L-arabinose transferase-like glycosyltransferase